MTQSIQFSSGLQLAPFVISSGLLRRSWNVISSQHEGIVSNVGEGLSWKVYKEPDTAVTIIAFEATPEYSSHLQPDLVLSSELKEKKNFLHFNFLCSKVNPVFSFNSTAVSLFCENYQKLDQLKSEINISNASTTKLIITGHALGGSVASLFTVSLLNSIGSGNNRPLCITFGSPLVGDKTLQQAISRSSNWKSCFLHVVSHKDPLPRLFVTDSTSAYMPFGTFLLCSDASSTCFENPDSTMELLMAFSSIHAQNEGFQSAEYGNIVKNLNLKALHKDFITKSEDLTYPADSLASCISLQLRALGLTHHMQQLQNIDINSLETNMKKQEEGFIKQRRIVFDPSKKLNQIKENMAQLEWYKKETKNKGIGYYDSYKNMNSPWDNDVVQFHKKLKNYWEKMVGEVEVKPQTEGAAFRKRWLFGGTTYRRMVEPLAIAQYYKDGGEDYVTKERSKHFKQLEEWLKESNGKDLESTSKKNVEAILTIDSCFWAHVEEALRSCKELKAAKEKEEELKKLVEFEEYVYKLLKNYAVSPEIFLEKSSFMFWWMEYKGIKGTSYSSPLVSFMNIAANRDQYTLGAYDFP
ncbi:senescence-associated carboxylesterase 101-like isoform X2 [Lotus japonicus]|uniref:senescence-associated carboxylesterase 101-like isoform X2 n=1 Tax=Lotus japonicus TaxID=34305 RepID=UPI00258351AC|nr:senescence-associated carboxylesterase 101-like isoform X2 [Lotus japonicus]